MRDAFAFLYVCLCVSCCAVLHLPQWAQPLRPFVLPLLILLYA